MDEAERHRLHASLAAKLGDENARVLMSLLPPVGWADVATKDDVRLEIAILRSDLERRMAELETRTTTAISSLEARITTAMRHQLFALLAAMCTISTLTVAAAALV